MTDSAVNAFQCEMDFLSGVGKKLDAEKGKRLSGSKWKRAGNDESDRVRALMAEAHCYDRERLKSLPANRRIELHGFERRLLFWTKPTGVAIASVLSPLRHYASSAEGEAPTIGLGELTDHVRQLVRERRVPHIIGICSPTGFTEEARQARLDIPHATVVLVEPNERGGWVTTAAGDDVDPALLQIFDPERSNEKVERVWARIDQRSADLLTGGLSVSSVARETNLSQGVVRSAFEQKARDDPELRSSEKDGEFLLYRGAPARIQERRSMNVIDRIKQLFSSEGDEAEKVNLLSERRAALAQRRDRIYEDIGKLEKKEAELLEQGKAAKSHVPRRRLAAQLAQLRKDIGRQNSTAAMLNKQIDIISTDIHNLTLIQQGEMASLPDTEELTENAVKAEEMLESLTADAELVGSLESGMEQVLASEEELAILREFEEADKPAAAPDSARTAHAAPTPPQAEPSRPAAQSAEEPPSGEPEPEQKARPADPEAT
ncbi:MAG: hypothetical protein ACYTFA_09750 [Planctomycetota bacterium]|jgi:hypothetical protein